MFPSRLRQRLSDGLLLARDFLLLEDDYGVDWGLDDPEEGAAGMAVTAAACAGRSHTSGQARFPASVAHSSAAAWGGCMPSAPPCAPRIQRARAWSEH